MRRRRFIGMSAAGLSSALGLSVTATACGGGDSGGDGRLRMLVTEFGDLLPAGVGTVERFWTGLVAEFRQVHRDIDVEIIPVDYQDAYLETMAMAERGEAPDIAQLYAFAEFAEEGSLYNAGELLTVPVLADFPAAIAAAGEVRRVQYGIPFTAVVQQFFYSKPLFEDAGLDPEQPPQTWDELLDVANALKANGVPIPFALPLGHDDAVGEAAMWMLSGGGSLTDTAGAYTLKSPANVDVFEWLRDRLVGTGLTGEAPPREFSRQQAYGAFLEGRAGMVIGDNRLMSLAETEDADYGIAAMPGRRSPSPSATGDASWLIGFNQRGNREHIATFLDYVFSEHHNVTSFAEQYGLLPVSTPAQEDMLANDAPEVRRLRPFLDQMTAASFFPGGKASWTEVSTWIGATIGDAVEPGADVEGILGQLQTQAEELDQGRD